MKTNEPPYQLVRTRVSDQEWIFNESADAFAATLEFETLLERTRGGERLASLLRAFLKAHPWHFDAMTHYASCKMEERKYLEAYAFSMTAVATAREAFPSDFDEAIHQIPGGFVQNRPFLRALHGKMQAAAAIGELGTAIATGKLLLKLDIQDRMGGREDLPRYLLREGRYQEAIDLFESEDFRGTFGRAEYLRPVTLLYLKRRAEAIASIEDCLRTPATARYILDGMLPRPDSDSPIGGYTSGSDLEGWYHAKIYRDFWVDCPASSSSARPPRRSRWLDGRATTPQ